MLICTCTEYCNNNIFLSPALFAKEAVYVLGKAIDLSSLKNTIKEYRPEFPHDQEGDILDLSVSIPISSYILTHSIDCVCRNIILPAVNTLTEKICYALKENYQSVNNEKSGYVKGDKILLTFYPIVLPPLTWSARVTSTDSNISLAVWKEFDIDKDIFVIKISTFIVAKFICK